jgi:hypothetical protein
MKPDTLEKFLRSKISRRSVITDKSTVAFLEDRSNNRLLPRCWKCCNDRLRSKMCISADVAVTGQFFMIKRGTSSNPTNLVNFRH